MAPIAALWRHRELVAMMTRREIAGRYRGMVIGRLWLVLQPLLMLGVFAFVFGFVLDVRFGTEVTDFRSFAVTLFAGLIVFWLFSECVSRAPGLVTGNVNLVKRVVFPLEILPLTVLGASLFHALISYLVLIAAAAFLVGPPPATALLLPVVLAPLVLLLLGIGWIFAALGVFYRDIGQVTGLLLTLAMFASPIFYPIEALPAPVQSVLYLNPVTLIVEESRAVLLWGRAPDWAALAIYGVIAAAIARAGYALFVKARRGFNDVL